MPPAELPLGTALAHYSRGIAFAATDRFQQAEAKLAAVREIAQAQDAAADTEGPGVVFAIADTRWPARSPCDRERLKWPSDISYGWSLYGLAQSLKARGREPEAEEVLAQFRAAWKDADVELIASRL